MRPPRSSVHRCDQRMPYLQLGYADRAQPSIVVPSHPSFDSSMSDSDESRAKRSSSDSDACLATPAYGLADPNEPVRSMTRTFLRKKKGEGHRATDEPIMLTLEFVSALFNMPLKEAAARIGMCPTSLKLACRKLGIPRWPFRATPRCSRTSSSSAPTESARRPPARLRRADWSAASCAAWSLADTSVSPPSSPNQAHEHDSEIVEATREPRHLRAPAPPSSARAARSSSAPADLGDAPPAEAFASAAPLRSQPYTLNPF